MSRIFLNSGTLIVNSPQIEHCCTFLIFSFKVLKGTCHEIFCTLFCFSPFPPTNLLFSKRFFYRKYDLSFVSLSIVSLLCPYMCKDLTGDLSYTQNCRRTVVFRSELGTRKFFISRHQGQENNENFKTFV